MKILNLFIIGLMTWNVHGQDLGTWLGQERATALSKIEDNISRPDAAVGSVVASPQRSTPNYYYHWTRDASLTMDLIAQLHHKATSTMRDHYAQILLNFAKFSRQTQLEGDVGEPKFEVDGRIFAGPWCRPQTDGPAIRAIALIRFANTLLDQGQTALVERALYDADYPADTVIKTDLEYVAARWSQPSCDLWEEISGDHFFTRMSQRQALLDGADLADRLNDPGAAKWYRLQAAEIQDSLSEFWIDPLIVPTLNRNAGIDYKSSGIDSSVILAAVHFNRRDGFLPLLDSKLQSTFQAQVNTFKNLYPINWTAGAPGVAIGRYPEDRYDGASNVGGNPWILLTAVFARYCYDSALDLWHAGNTKDAQSAFMMGDSFMARVRYHANPDGSLSEQMNRRTGYLTSARDLTWNYVEVVEAIDSRDAYLRVAPRHRRRH